MQSPPLKWIYDAKGPRRELDEDLLALGMHVMMSARHREPDLSHELRQLGVEISEKHEVQVSGPIRALGLDRHHGAANEDRVDPVLGQPTYS
jgi:hypothetical protein